MNGMTTYAASGRREQVFRHPNGRQEYLPSREEIRRACREIQSTWSENERAARAGFRPKILTVPVTRCVIDRSAISGEDPFATS